MALRRTEAKYSSVHIRQNRTPTKGSQKLLWCGGDDTSINYKLDQEVRNTFSWAVFYIFATVSYLGVILSFEMSLLPENGQYL